MNQTLRPFLLSWMLLMEVSVAKAQDTLPRDPEPLNLADNHLRDLPGDFSQLSQLQYLHLSHNRFKRVPKVLLEMPSLTKVDLSGNNIPPRLRRKFEQEFGGQVTW